VEEATHTLLLLPLKLRSGADLFPFCGFSIGNGLYCGVIAASSGALERKNIYWNGPDLLVVEVRLVVLLSAGLPMPLVAFFGTILAFKKIGRGSGNCCYRLSPRGSFQKLSKK